MYDSYLSKKLASKISNSVVPALCCWSDLRGFGNDVSENDWTPSSSTWEKIAKRLQDAQTICVQSIKPNENVFILNDGFVRNYNLSLLPRHFQAISLWFRDLIYFHISLNFHEKQQQLLGMRSVVSAGNRLRHNWDIFTVADLFIEFPSKTAGHDSDLQKTNSHKIMENPLPLQMNTAFSRAYLIDDAGSEKKIDGSNFYIDQSVIKLLQDLAKHYSTHCGDCIWKEKEDSILFAIINSESNWYQIGFELEKPIKLEHHGVKTNVYKVQKFYPWDEDPNDFNIPLSLEKRFYMTPKEFQSQYPNNINVIFNE